jgi:hypothetical protein
MVHSDVTIRTGHKAIITHADLLNAFIQPFLKDVADKGFFSFTIGEGP